jgi:hypothetical protein
MVHGPKSEVDCSFNFGAPCFFTLQSSTPGTPVVATALEFALNVRILSHHHGSINSHSPRRCGSNDGGWMDPFLLFAFHFILFCNLNLFHLFAINYVWTCQFMDAIFM